MATIVNARDVILQAASPRIEPIALPSNVVIDTANLAAQAVTPAKTNIPAIDSTTGDLADDAFLSTTGYVKAAGTLLSLVTYAGKYGAATGQFITSGGAADVNEWDIGVWGQLNGTATAAGKIGVIGIADQSNGYGVIGVSAAGYGVYAESSSGYALAVVGKMSITSSDLVYNLNAEKLGGVGIAGFARRDDIDIEYSTDGGSTWNNIRFR